MSGWTFPGSKPVQMMRWRSGSTAPRAGSGSKSRMSTRDDGRSVRGAGWASWCQWKGRGRKTTRPGRRARRRHRRSPWPRRSPRFSTQIRTSEDYDDEPRPWKPSKAGVPDLLKTNQILLAAVGAGALILIVAFAFVALRTSGRGPIQEAASTEHAKGPAPADTVVTEDRKKIRPEDMPGAAHLWILLYIQDTLKSQPKTESVRVDDVEVRPIHDDRKIEWLWEATATVSLAVQSDTPGQAATRMPDDLAGCLPVHAYWYARECWREVVEMKFGQKYRKHFGFSEWNSRFRSEIRSRWTRDFRAWDAEMRRRGESDADRIRYLQDLKMGTAQTLGLSAEELQEIVEATD